MTLGIGFIMWDKIGPVWMLFLVNSLGLCYSVFIISFLSEEGLVTKTRTDLHAWYVHVLRYEKDREHVYT